MKPKVHLEPKDMWYEPAENCSICGAPTRYWLPDRHTPLCLNCCREQNSVQIQVGDVESFGRKTAVIWKLLRAATGRHPILIFEDRKKALAYVESHVHDWHVRLYWPVRRTFETIR